MKILLLSLFLLVSTSVQADNTCDDLEAYIISSLATVDRVWMVMVEKKRLYISTTKRHRPYLHEERKKSYERYTVIYNNLAIVHNQQVDLYRENCN